MANPLGRLRGRDSVRRAQRRHCLLVTVTLGVGRDLYQVPSPIEQKCAAAVTQLLNFRGGAGVGVVIASPVSARQHQSSDAGRSGGPPAHGADRRGMLGSSPARGLDLSSFPTGSFAISGPRL
ncbi:hypothetical protein GCM10010211_76380 [Streptomyces albospinus]|uniref:Uncharacterized protein n=1 Tax=Streptomyces albospinus TaxID=285515 RepID=A0ABQ2VNR8_9ACTN|nr:hypothetical protein GCM10010211_76380 [Streptomyces albospinus]